MNPTTPRPYLTSVTRVADLFSSRVRDGERVDVLGYNSEADGGGQQVYYDALSNATIDDGNVLWDFIAGEATLTATTQTY